MTREEWDARVAATRPGHPALLDLDRHLEGHRCGGPGCRKAEALWDALPEIRPW